MEQATSEVPKFGVKCVRCGYDWITRTKLLYISCPNCRHTNKTAKASATFTGEPVVEQAKKNGR